MDSMQIVSLSEGANRAAAGARNSAIKEMRYLMAEHYYTEHRSNYRVAARKYGLKWKDLQSYIETGEIPRG